jgi:hypothetical protein
LFNCLAVGGAGVLLGLRRSLSRRVVIAALLIGVAAAFPVAAEWDEEGHRAPGLVPAGQAALMPIWPRSAWNSERPKGPLVGYAYSCCGSSPRSRSFAELALGVIGELGRPDQDERDDSPARDERFAHHRTRSCTSR